MTRLMFKCPRTNRLVPTHVDIDLAEIDKLPDRVTFSQCPFCSTVHGWTPKDTWVSEGMKAGRQTHNGICFVMIPSLSGKTCRDQTSITFAEYNPRRRLSFDASAAISWSCLLDRGIVGKARDVGCAATRR